ncbi:16S rRNA processing protein RimM [Rhodovulum sp. PH10]|uniref:ribosome maturation factor RimM n=1 Tax=Rhodovulum sp. PH10 TaxID=1187851 RepID=UPI00027C2E59|nr:ribosome maturation factor RimM [Rhodovulum sp. PH10]EJW09915.1 16S rRNA processing protein RimM [Rhodovulum sp. PH10]
MDDDRPSAPPAGAGPAGAARKDVCVARIGAPHGVRGEMRLWSFTADPAAVKDYGPLHARDGRVFEIESLRPAKDCLVARLKGVGDRDAAEALKNLDLFVAREKLAAPEEDEFYHADLIGLAAVDTAGQPLGTVIAVQNFGAGDILEIAPSRGRTFLAPFTKAMVPEVDVSGGRVVLDPPPGFFDEEEPPPSEGGPSEGGPG